MSTPRLPDIGQVPGIGRELRTYLVQLEKFALGLEAPLLSNDPQLPRIRHIDDDRVQITNAPGDPTAQNLSLPGLRSNRVNLPVEVSLQTSGELGLDTGLKDKNTFYSYYLVPEGDGSGITGMCSANGPDAGGPVGKPNNVYVGTILTDANKKIRAFNQEITKFSLSSTIIIENPPIRLDGLSDQSPVEINLEHIVPPAASSVLLSAALRGTPNSETAVNFYVAGSLTGNPRAWIESKNENFSSIVFSMPLPLGRKIYRKIFEVGRVATYKLFLLGWKDGYLS